MDEPLRHTPRLQKVQAIMRVTKAFQPPVQTADDYIETYTGRRFFLDTPDFDIKDIAHALSNICRYSGHCARRYSVAEHSILVSYIMEDQSLGEPFEGLMHDAHEAYIGDIASPWKQYLPDYVALEHRLESRMRSWAGLSDKISDGCKLADYTALILEARVLIPSGAKDWKMNPAVTAMADKVQDDYHIMCFDYESARREFMGRYQRLRIPVCPVASAG